MFKASLSIVLAALNTLLIAAASPTTTTPTKSVQVVAPASTKANGGISTGVSSGDTAQTDEVAVESGGLEDRVLVDVDPDAPIKPRRVNAKVPVRGPGSIETRISPTNPKSGNVVFKVRDDLKARTGRTFGTQLTSAATSTGQGLRLAPTNGQGTDKDRELDEIRAVLRGFNATIRQCISMSPAELSALEIRARDISRVEQPDLAGIIYARPGAQGMESELAEQLNALPSVEYAEVEYLPRPAQDSCQKDVSLQSGGSAAGADIEQGTNCISYTDNQGNPADCPTPPPVFIAQRGDGAYRAIPAPFGVVPCHAPDRWSGYITSVARATGCDTGNPSYTPDPTAQPATFDCTPNCNQGGSGACANPPTGYTSVQGCQYGCQDQTCVDVVVAQGFTNCNNLDSGQGWDSLCATIANIYCGGQTGYNPYSLTGAYLPQGRPGTGWLPDEGTQTCYQLSQSTLAPTWPTTALYTFGSSGVGLTAGGADGDATTYDSCFARRGPANPPTIDPARASPAAPVPSAGVVAYADVGDGSGIRPWGFNFNPATAVGSLAYANAFLTASTPSGTFVAGACPLGYVTVVGGEYLWSLDPSDTAHASEAEFNLALKSYPYYFSHDCFTFSPVTPGCFATPCCVYICILDPSCCTVAWDDGCVSEARSATICNSAALSTTAFPPSSLTPDFRGSPVTTSTPPTTSQGLQVWNIGLPVASSCSQYVTNNPTAQPGQISLQAISNQAGLSTTSALLNTGFGGRGIAVTDAIASVTATYPSINPDSLVGSGLNVGVIDSSCFPDHEVLADAYNNGRLIIEPGQTLVVTPPGATPLIDPDHGTAVLAMLIGQPVLGVGGVTGVVPQATAYFFPSQSVSEAGRLPTAIARAGQTLQPGDILAIPLAYSGNYNTGESVALSAVQTVRTLLSVCFSVGITTFQPAGNGAFEVSLKPGSGTTDGDGTFCVTVGAAWPGSQIPLPSGASGNLICSRITTFPGNSNCRFKDSNWTSTQGPGTEPGIDVAGWGTGICTAGYGLLWAGDNPPSTGSVYSNPDLTTNRLRTYQYDFGGTSGATAQVSCLAAMMQGFAKTYYGAPVSPARIRQILANQLDPADGTGTGYLNTCIIQCGQTPGTELPGTVDSSPIVVKNGDLVAVNPQSGPHQVGGFPLATPCLFAVAATTFNPGGTPFNVTVVKGTVRGGGSSSASYAFACGRLDNYFLKIQGVRTGRGSTGQAYGPPFPYAANGLVTDIQLRANTLLASIDDFDNMSFSATGAATNGTAPPGGTSKTALTMAYVYNRVSRRWNFLAYGFLSNVSSTPIATNLAATYMPSANFLVTEGSDRVVYFRVVTYPFGLIGPYQAWWDLFNIQTNSTLPTK